MKKTQPSSAAYVAFGALTIIASLAVGFIIFSSGLFKITAANHFALLIVGAVYGLSIFAIVVLIVKWQEAPGRIMTLQSHQMLTIANQTLTFLRKGFSYDSAAHVANIIHDNADVDAVAVTDGSHIMAFAGYAAECHKPGDPAISPVRSEVVTSGEMAVFEGDEEEGCRTIGHRRWLGVTVPLKVSKRVVGTIDFLYLVPGRMTDNRLTVATRLGTLLSTQLELAELDEQRQLAVQAELRALRAQINPHFLFNTLNTIAALCRTDPLTARRLTIKFAEFFRDSLERQSQFTTLEEELNYVNLYLGLEQARFGSRLKIYRLVDKDARALMLPSLMIQPIVENAIKHGMTKSGILNLRLAAKVKDGHLLVKVSDNGKGMLPDAMQQNDDSSSGHGIGLSNIRQRLRAIYGASGLLKIESEAGHGTTVQVELPLENIPTEAVISDN